MRSREEARVALCEAMKTGGHTQSWLSNVLKVSQPTVSSWMTGKFYPGPEYRPAIRLLFGIPEESWMSDDERLRLAEAADAVASLASQEHSPKTGTDDGR
jgi:transcriptional regulator with XRE-family HTH domain